MVSVAGGYLFISSRGKNAGSDTGSIKPADKKDEVKAGFTYQDESGFSFGYPKGIKVTDVTPDDEIYYSKLDLTKGKDVLTISLMDTKAKSIDEWVKNETSYENSALVGATSLAGISAKQYVNQGKMLTLAIDSGVLYFIESLKDSGYWEDVQNIVVSSFKLIENDLTSGSGSAVDNAIYEQEELVE